MKQTLTLQLRDKNPNLYNLMREHFNYSMNWDLLDLIAEMLIDIQYNKFMEYKQALKNNTEYDYLIELYNTNIYLTNDIGTLIKEYILLDELDADAENRAMELFLNDIQVIANKYLEHWGDAENE